MFVKLAGSAFAVTAARVTAQAMQFILFLAAAKFLSVAEFGKFSIVLVITLGFAILGESGWREFVIQERDSRTWKNLNTIAASVSTFMAIIGLMTTAVMWFLWKDIGVTVTAAALSVWIILRALTGVQSGILTVQGKLAQLGSVQILAEIIGLLAGLVSLYYQMGIVSLAIAKLVCQSAYLGGYASQTRSFGWTKPTGSEFRRILTFSKEILAIRITQFAQANVATLLMGIWFGPVGASIYRAGQRIVGAATETLTEPSRILVWSRLRSVRDRAERDHNEPGDSVAALRDEGERLLLIVVAIASPIFASLAFSAPQIVRVLLGEKWLPAVPIIQILCIANALRFVMVISEPLFSLLSDPRSARRLTTIDALVLLVLLPVAAPHGVQWVATAEVLAVLFILPFFLRSFRINAGLRLSHIVPPLMVIVLGIFLTLSGWSALDAIAGWGQDRSMWETAALLATGMTIYAVAVGACGIVLWKRGLLPGHFFLKPVSHQAASDKPI